MYTRTTSVPCIGTRNKNQLSQCNDVYSQSNV